MVKRILILLAFIILVAAAGIAVFLQNTYSRVVVTPIAGSPGELPSPTPDPDAPFTVLLLGYGGGAHEGGLLTDTIIAMHVDPKTKRASMISIPRDLWVNLPDTVETSHPYKINHAYAIGADNKQYRNKPARYTGEAGGGEMAKYAVSEVLGIPVNYFAAISFRGFTKSVDVLGGLDVNVTRTFDDFYYPIDGKETDTCGRSPEDIAALTATMSGELLEHEFPCRFEHLHFDRGMTHMDGVTALKYVRSRHSLQDGTDFGRSNRQQTVIAAVRSRVLTIGFIPKIIPFISSLTGDMQTDIGIETAKRYLPEVQKADQYSLQSLTITTDNALVEARSSDGQYILNPKEGEFRFGKIHEMVKNFLESTGSATPAVPGAD